MDRYILEKADRHSANLFQVTKNRPQLELLIIDKVHQGLGKWTLEARPRLEINTENEFDELVMPEISSEWTHIYTIQRVRSWKPLDISRTLFDRLLKLHNVFPEIWRVVLTFGFKSFENEYNFPTLQVRESGSKSVDTQVAYVLRRVEENGRDPPECPWSIRQTGVYQKFTLENGQSSGPASVLLLLAPSREAENEFLRSFAGKTSDNADAVTLAFSAHECLVAESLAGWGDYMCWLEEQLKMKSARIMAIPLNVDQENRALNFDAKDRQSLKEIEFQITDMLVILQTKVGTIRQIKRVCQRYCSLRCPTRVGCACSRVAERFEDLALEAQNYQERAKVLQTRVQSVQNLLSDLLGYEEVRTLRELAKASNEESAIIKQLTVRTVQDATAVKLLTLIGLVFLPTTMVENFFSTQFVQTEGGGLQISKYVWVMVAVAVPLTAFVVFCWRMWVRYEYAHLPSAGLTKQRLKRLFGRRISKTEEATSIG